MNFPKKQHIDIIAYRAKSLLTTEGSRNYLSFLWWIIDPLMELCIFYVVFGLILRRGGPEFVAELLTGIFIIRLFISATSAAPNLLIHSEHVLLSVAIPKYIFPAAHTLTCCFKFFLLLLLLYVFLVLLGSPPHASNLWILPLTIAYMTFTLGVAMLLAGLTPFVPDIAMLYPKIIMVLYWSSGVFFKPADYIPTSYLPLFYVNPVAGFITAYRDCMLHATIDLKLVGYLVVVSMLSLLVGYSFLSRFDKEFPRIVAQR
ncbi:ABC transporter permease [Nitratidesulfovibrio sp. 1201_IL3209]|uniref:ABC transporter permease n=1 Tax=Nitratidesulfovibrio sp. 1201_IL3209 TaxID=3084053 RepID=UPI002FDB5DFE